MTVTSNEFAQRARRYREWDEHLGTYTRFFAAAALTNAVLAEVCARRGHCLWISQSSIGALARLGRMLEAVNLARARSIGRYSGTGLALDASFIEMEQSLVETVLRAWAPDRSRGCRRLVSEVDRLLRAAAAGILPLQSASASLYGRALRSLTLTSDRYPTFALRSDRVRIGHALIQSIRSQVPGRPVAVEPADLTVDTSPR